MSAQRNPGIEAILFTSIPSNFRPARLGDRTRDRPLYVDPRCGNGTKSGRRPNRAAPHARASFMAAASRGVVGPFVCVQRRQRSLGRFPRVGPIRVREGIVAASATARVELGFRRERTATNRQDEAQNATGESVLRARSFSFSRFSRCLSHSLVIASFWLSSSRSAATDVSLAQPSRDLSLENQIPVVERRAIVIAKRSEDAITRPRDSRGKSWVRFLWLASGARRTS